MQRLSGPDSFAAVVNMQSMRVGFLTKGLFGGGGGGMQRFAVSNSSAPTWKGAPPERGVVAYIVML